MGTNEFPDLTALEFRPDCQGAWREGGIGKIKCGAIAVYAIRIHLLDHCNVPNLDDHGNRVFVCCAQCCATTGTRLQALITELYDGLPDKLPCPECKALLTGDNEYLCETCDSVYTPKVVCLTCSKPIVSLHDLYEVEPL